LNEKILSLEEELYEQRFNTVELIESTKDMEFQLSKSQSKIAELMTNIQFMENKQSIYIPKKNDDIDKALGNFLKNYKER